MQDENDSQQAAEAMIQLGYYSAQQHHDESLDFDPNYDPSDFLMKKDSEVQQEPEQIAQQQYQEAFEYSGMIPETTGDEMQAQQQHQQAYYENFPQAFNAGEFGFQPANQSQEEFSQSQPQQLLMQPADGGGLADLEISDSDDDENDGQELNVSNTSQNQEEGFDLCF